MKVKDLIDLSGDRDLAKSYPKADGVYIWDYKVLVNEATNVTELHLIPSDSGKAGYKDKVSVDEIVNYLIAEYNPEVPSDDSMFNIPIVGVEGITIARI